MAQHMVLLEDHTKAMTRFRKLADSIKGTEAHVIDYKTRGNTVKDEGLVVGELSDLIYQQPGDYLLFVDLVPDEETEDREYGLRVIQGLARQLDLKSGVSELLSHRNFLVVVVTAYGVSHTTIARAWGSVADGIELKTMMKEADITYIMEKHGDKPILAVLLKVNREPLLDRIALGWSRWRR